MKQSGAYRNLANQRWFFKTKIPLHHCALPYSVGFRNPSRTNCPNWTANSRTSGTNFGLCPMADAKLNHCFRVGSAKAEHLDLAPVVLALLCPVGPGKVWVPVIFPLPLLTSRLLGTGLLRPVHPSPVNLCPVPVWVKPPGTGQSAKSQPTRPQAEI